MLRYIDLVVNFISQRTRYYQEASQASFSRVGMPSNLVKRDLELQLFGL